jgi:hypothetical protein
VCKEITRACILYCNFKTTFLLIQINYLDVTSMITIFGTFRLQWLCSVFLTHT